MRIVQIEEIDAVAAHEWNRLSGGIDNPFLRHEFLSGLERFGCVGERWGWLPRHLLAYEGDRLVGAVPLYLKDNSYGEFVFDWAWADAYRRAGLPYYPKLVAAIPYAPVTGPRLLLAAGTGDRTAEEMIQATIEVARSSGVSSLHWLFPDGSDTARLQEAGLLLRQGCQFHWENRGYRDFTDFLSTFRSEKRKKLLQERRRVVEAGIEMEVLSGREAGRSHWAAMHRFYTGTFERLGGYATLTRPFFEHLGATLPAHVVLVLARQGGRYVAGALSLRSGDTLYGRHWGCDEEFHGLHFEACYYRGIEYCIEHRLQRFEPGAQGEHKIARGFVPTTTWSAHWIAHPRFSRILGDYLVQERQAVGEYMEELREHLPFKKQEVGK